MARNYKLTGTFGLSYRVRIAYEPGITVYSNRKTKGQGKLVPDDGINWEDIVLQIQGPFKDYDIERLADTADKGDEGYREEDEPVEAEATEDKFLPRRG